MAKALETPKFDPLSISLSQSSPYSFLSLPSLVVWQQPAAALVAAAMAAVGRPATTDKAAGWPGVKRR